ncbi:MAG: hypothetical protein KAS32_15775 [Candidatus Peribacteraceae bacterium]|nr:hypothetical protein [Candidatus Peribacteraceae bacterium]
MALPDRSKLTPEQIVIMDKIAIMPISEYTLGICRDGHHGKYGKPFKKVKVIEHSIARARQKAWEDIDGAKYLYTVCLLHTDPNPERVKLMKEVGWL